MSSSANADRAGRIRTILQRELSASEIDVIDESHRHRGHPGARSGGGHFRLRVISDCFGGQSRIERHRMVYRALEAEFGSEIHALAISALTPIEANAPADES